jgi:hypothetical protein
MIIMLLMFVGAGPGSMAGGITLTTANGLLALIHHRLRGVGASTLERAVVLITVDHAADVRRRADHRGTARPAATTPRHCVSAPSASSATSVDSVCHR